MWRTIGTNSLSRGLSSDPSLAPLSLQAGSHGHWNWTFSKAGVYRLDMVASYTSTWSQRAVNSLPSTITWLVGSDDEVGLPEGTTTSLTPIGTTAEQMKEKMIASGELSTEETPAEPEPPFTQAEARKQIEALFGSTAKAPASPSSPSHYVYKGTFKDDVRAGVPIKRVTLEVNANGKSIPGEPILEIPDSLKQTTADGDRWVLPASGEHGSLGFDFTQMPADLRSGPAVYSIDTFDGPKGSRYIAGTVTDGAMNVTLDTTRDPNRGFTVDAAAVPLAHVFTKPGVYAVGFNIETRDKDGNFSYKSRSAHFVVGDAAISALRAITAENNGEAPSPSPNPADPDADAPPSGGVQPGNPSIPDPANPSAPSRPGDSAIHIITEGHMDQANVPEGREGGGLRRRHRRPAPPRPPRLWNLRLRRPRLDAREDPRRREGLQRTRRCGTRRCVESARDPARGHPLGRLLNPAGRLLAALKQGRRGRDEELHRPRSPRHRFLLPLRGIHAPTRLDEARHSPPLPLWITRPPGLLLHEARALLDRLCLHRAPR